MTGPVFNLLLESRGGGFIKKGLAPGEWQTIKVNLPGRVDFTFTCTRGNIAIVTPPVRVDTGKDFSVSVDCDVTLTGVNAKVVGSRP